MDFIVDIYILVYLTSKVLLRSLNDASDVWFLSRMDVEDQKYSED